jgi:hypothetical protein
MLVWMERMMRWTFPATVTTARKRQPAAAGFANEQRVRNQP